MPVRWLRDYVDIAVPLEELARLLTMAGIETEIANDKADAWRHMWVGRITALERVPQSKHLQLATVDYGHGVRQVVTGASNLKEGQVVPYAEVGASYIDGKTGERATLKPTKLLGVRSEGMVMSEKELGLGEDHEGILILNGQHEVGEPLAEALGESVFVCELQPNRADCLGVLGLAREVAAILGADVREPALAHSVSERAADFTVRVEAPDACLRYDAALIRGVTVAPSPEWLQRRLLSVGLRPVNNVVDVTNYVMLETGQPMHAFDRRQLGGGTIRVRRAAVGERLRTLDDVERILDPSVLVIADESRAVGIAGVIGGENTEIGADTRDVVLEVAKFENRGVGRTAMRLNLWTDAARRFSWDLSPELVPFALRRATLLLREVAGGETYAVIDVYPERRVVPNIRMPFTAFRRLLGVELPRDLVTDALRRIGCRYAVDGDLLVVTPPPWRTDINIPEDVVEEAARIVGYDHIPLHIPDGELMLHERHPDVEFRERARDALVGFGLQEVVSHALIDPDWLPHVRPDGTAARPEPLRVTNPTSREQSVVRPTLEPSLLDTARRNLRWASGVALFEIAPVYLPRRADLPDERWTIGILLAGRVHDAPRTWVGGETHTYDFFALKGIVERLADALRIALPELEPGDPALHPGRSALARQDEQVMVRLGQLHPVVAERWALPGETFVAFLDLAFLASRQVPIVAELPSRYPSAYRDVAIVVDDGIGWARVREDARSAAGKTLADLTLLDVYRGPQLPEGKKSFAMRLTFQSREATLADQEIERLVRRVVSRLERALGATLRA
ncbi:MAG TPA: phenylalanine--tRNA ligase subunit beta [Candidatus Dormibacteraeota bacterium]|nr:phenylalanine--tRNA ligase subunit beta [Candidatus Dormibacteraeota bacterium]